MIESNDPIELANEIKKSFEKLIHLHDEMLAKLPEDERKKVAPIQADIHNTLKAVKDGDITKINEISKKYASYDFNGNI